MGVTRRGPDNSVRVAISGTISTKSFANVFHCQLTTSGTISQADLNSWLTLFANQYKTSFAGRQSASISYVTATASLYIPGGGVLQAVSPMTGSGTSGGTGIQDNSAAKCITWLSTVFWRGGKPRTYLGGASVSEVTSGNTLTAGEISALKTAAAGFLTAVNALTQGTITGTTLGFVSFFTGNAPRTPSVFFAYTGSTVHSRLASQRRRLGKWVQ